MDGRPPTLALLRPRSDTVIVSRGRTVLAASRAGMIEGEAQHGLWVYQTRMLSRYRWLVQGQPPELSAQSNVQQHSWLGYYIASPPGIRETGKDESDPAQRTLELRLSRSVGEGLHEDVDLTNFSQAPAEVRLELELAADFADPKEAGGERKQRGRLETRWRRLDGNDAELSFDYRVEHAYEHQGDRGVARIHRALRLDLRRAQSPPEYSEGRLAFRIRLSPRESWHACLLWTPSMDGRELPPEPGCHFRATGEADERDGAFLAKAASFASPESSTLTATVLGALERGRRDLLALRLHDLDSDGGPWVPAGGVPTYVALFGRDSLAAGWEALMLGPEPAAGALQRLREWQGTREDDWRDEQPGRLVHELHTNPLAALGFTPHGRYYGGSTASLYYGTVVAGLWHWTGDERLVRPLLGPALSALRWADRYGDIDGDGFYEYKTRSEQGEKNQGWKDSNDAIVYEDGSLVEDPLGTCEMQSFAYASKLHLAEVLWWLDEKGESRRLRREAEELKKRFNDAFWLEEEGTFAMGLDSKKRPIRSISSDPGHCLASGIVDESRAGSVARRLMSEELFSGWGVRTLSSRHPAYDPYAYHRGTVWPVENAVFALAMARYGLHEPMWRLCRAQFEAAALFEHLRLPECFAGHPRDPEHPFPGLYPKANWPQAWSASSVFTLLQSMAGLYPYAPLRLLLLDPHLPPWLPEVSVRGLRVGEAVLSLRLYRDHDGRTDYEVTDLKGSLHVVRQPSPWSLTAGTGERLRDALESLLPGR